MTTSSTIPKKQVLGFTLIELLITVAIIGILASIAVPTYDEHIRRTHRTNAKNAIIQASQWMERAATSTGAYPLTAAVPGGILAVEGGRYTVTPLSDGATFSFTATRNSGTGQLTDRCGDFRIDNANRRTLLGASAGTTVADCWGR